MQIRAVAPGKIDRQRRGLVARLDGADVGMLGEGDVVTVPLPGPGFVGENRGGVFAVGGDHQRGSGEYALECGGVVHQHVAGAGAHEHLDAAGGGGVDRLDRLQVVVGRAQVEGVVGVGVAGGPAVLVVQRGLVDGQRVAVGHLHVAGDAARHGGCRLRGDGSLVGEAGFAKVGLVIDHAGQQPGAFGIEDFGSAAGCGAHCRNASVLDQQIAFDYRTFVDDACVDDALSGHGCLFDECG